MWWTFLYIFMKHVLPTKGWHAIKTNQSNIQQDKHSYLMNNFRGNKTLISLRMF